MRRLRRCKIIATIGPASASKDTLSALFHAGADVFRINMSHASHDAMRDQVGMIRAVQKEARRPIGILLDLQGPKLRIGLFKDRVVKLAKGETFALDSNPSPATRRGFVCRIRKSCARWSPAIRC